MEVDLQRPLEKFGDAWSTSMKLGYFRKNWWNCGEVRWTLRKLSQARVSWEKCGNFRVILESLEKFKEFGEVGGC